MQGSIMGSGQTKLGFFKSTYRLLFAIAIIVSIVLSVWVVIPSVCGVSWRGSLADEVGLVLVTWVVSSLIIGISFVCVVFVSALKLVREERRTGARLDQQTKLKTVSQVFSSSSPRWAISLTPALGPSLSLLIVAGFYRRQLPFSDLQNLLLACLLLGAMSFVICLPLTLWSQMTLLERVREKYPHASLKPDE
jgi:hypothetical protein